MATFRPIKRAQEEDSRNHPAKRARTEPEFELYQEVTGILKKYRHTPSVAVGVTAMFSLVFFFFFFFFFFTQVQTPVTLCSGELWSILVVRLAHSADLRSRLRHVSSAPSVAYSTGCSRVVTHPGTNPARRCLTSGQLLSLMEEELTHHQYKANLIFHVEFMKNNPSGLAKTTEAYFRSDVMTILSAHAIDAAVQKAFSDIEKRIEKWTREGSGWTVTKVLNVHLDFAKYTPLKGSSYLDLPDKLKSKKAIVNVKNNDNECLKWALLSALHPIDHGSHPDRVSKYKQYENELNFAGVGFPVTLKDIPKVEKQNNLAINVFGYASVIHPLYLTKDHSASPINLLLTTEVKDGKTNSHYTWIKDFNRLCCDQNKHGGKTFFCTRCISPTALSEPSVIISSTAEELMPHPVMLSSPRLI